MPGSIIFVLRIRKVARWKVAASLRKYRFGMLLNGFERVLLDVGGYIIAGGNTSRGVVSVHILFYKFHNVFVDQLQGAFVTA